MSETNYTVLGILKLTADHFTKKNIPEARLNAEMLLCHVLKCSRMNLYLDFDKPLKADELNAYRELIKRRQTHEPLQYILGTASFYRSDFKVNKNVLIPRQETEILVETFLNDIKDIEGPFNIFEVGTGTGCISISIAKELQAIGKEFSISAIDISNEAVKIADENKKNILSNDLNTSNVSFLVQDLFAMSVIDDKFTYIISNPPYIPKKEIEATEPQVKDFEPMEALTDGGEGIKFYRKIIEMSKGASRKIYFEIAYNAKEKLETLMKEMNVSNYRFVKDHSNNDRVLVIEL